MKSPSDRALARAPSRRSQGSRDAVIALLGASAIFFLTALSTGACDLLDTKNPPLPNEAPNRGQFVGGIAIGAGPGSGGSGAGLGTGGTSTITSAGGGNPAPPNCACAASYALGDTCLGCFDSEQSTACLVQESDCMGDSATPSCTTLFQNLLDCGATAGCAAQVLDSGAGNTAFQSLLQCDCTNCASSCSGTSC